MKTTTTRIALSLCCAILLPAQAHGQQAGPDAARIEQLTGVKETFDEKEGVFKVSLPHGDIAATVAGVKMSVPMGLGGWVAFKRVGGQSFFVSRSYSIF